MTKIRVENGLSYFRADKGCLIYPEWNPCVAAYVVHIEEGKENLLRECSIEEWKELVKDIPIQGVDMRNFRNNHGNKRVHVSKNHNWWK